MAQENPNRLSEWLEVAKAQAPVLRRNLAEFAGAVRENPGLLWGSRTVRYSTYGLGGLMLVWIVGGAVSLLTPAPPASAKPIATSADFHVVCGQADCGHHFVIHRDFGFRKFPVPCPKCHRETAMPARRCTSPKCGGRWVAPRMDEGMASCPVCGRKFD